MAPRTIYANLPDGLANLNLWDQSLADMGSLGMIPCTSSGTNAITLTTIASAFAPNISAPPQNLQNFVFVAAATSTGPVTVKVISASGTPAFLNLYKEDGVTQAGSGDISINVLYGIIYNSALNGNAGGYQIAFPITSLVNPVISGATITGSTITTSTYNGNTWTAGTGTLTIAAAKTLTANNSLTLAGTDATTMTFPTTSATIARTDAGQTFSGTQAFGALTATTVNGIGVAGVAAKTLTVNNSLTLAGVDATTITFQGTDTYVGRATTDTLTNKTLDTAGTGNVFKINGTQITANTGTGSNVLATSPTLVTPVLGTATATSVTFSPTTGGIVGTTTNDNASTGTVGEYVESVVAIGTPVSLTNATGKDVTTISLTAGDWDVEFIPNFTGGTTTTVTLLIGSISTTLNTLDQTNGRSVTQFPNGVAIFNVNNQASLGGITVRQSLSGTTTIHAVVFATFATSTCSAFGVLRARRVR